MTDSDIAQRNPSNSLFRKTSPLEKKSRRTAFLSSLAFLSQRLLFGGLVLLSIIFLSYLGLDMAGGTKFGPAIVNAFPKTWQYIDHLLQGELGLTTAGSNTLVPRLVTEVIVEYLPRSLGLLGISLLFASLMGILLGVFAARKRSRRSLGILITTLIGVSIPSFFAAFLLQWAATTYTRQMGEALLPVGGFGWDKHLILPALVLAARPVAQITRITFISVRDVLQQDYIRTAYGKGVHRFKVMTIHTMRNAAIPILTTIGVSLRFSLSSLPVVEYYFGWTGIGFALLKGIAKQDSNLTVALALCMGIIFITVNVLLDLSYRIIDPKLREKTSHITKNEKQKPLESIRATLEGFQILLADNFIVDWFEQRRANSTDIDQDEPPNATWQAEHEISKKSKKTSESAMSLGFPWGDILRNFPLLAGGFLVLGLIVIVFFGPQLAPHNPYHIQGFTKIDGVLSVPPFAPSELYPWGTDALGRDMLSLVMSGAQQTLMLGFLAGLARVLVGVILGAIGGWKSGSRLDRFILSLAEIISAFPTLLLGMMLILALGIRQGMRPFIIALCFVGWGEIMQFVRGEVMVIRPKLFIEGAVATGARTPRIIIRHILPNLFSALISLTALEIGAVLMLLGELGFISIFIGGGAIIDLVNGRILYSDVPEWGALLSNLRYQARSYPWTAIYPMLAFFVSILGFNLLGEGIRRLIEKGGRIINRVFNRYTVIAGLIAIVGLSWLSSNSGAMPFYKKQARTFDGERALNYVSILADPAWEGRALGSDGLDSAAQFIASEFEALGLQTAGQKNTYFQERFRAFERLVSAPIFAFNDGGSQPVHGIDYTAYPGYNMTHGEAQSPIRFIGMGKPSNAQVAGWRTSYPTLERSDFTGEILLVLSDREADYLTRFPKDGLLVVVDDSARLEQRYTLSGRTGKPLNLFTGKESGKETPSLWITEEMGDRLLAGTGYTVDKLREMNRDLPLEAVQQLPLQTEASIEVNGTLEERWPVQNVLGYIPGSSGYELCVDCLDTDLIVVMAQYDSPPIGPNGEIYPAAIDNASGVAVMLEAIRVLQETDYQPYRSFLFVAYSGEGLDGGESVFDPDVSRFLQAKTGFAMAFDLEAIVQLRGLGGGFGERLEVSVAGSLRLAKLLGKSARQMGVKADRVNEAIDIGVIYAGGNPSLESGQDAPIVRLYWEGWEEYSRLPIDRLENVSAYNLEEAGRALAMALMIMGRETEY